MQFLDTIGALFASLMVDITTFVAAIFEDWLPLVIDAISTNPVLLLFVICIPVCGIAVSMFNRLVRSN